MRKLFTCLLFTLATIGAFAQSVDLNTAIKNGAAYFEQNLQGGSTVAVLSIRSESLTLSEYIIDELSSYLVNGRTFTVVDRANIDLIQREMNYQLSGDVSDETAQSIGKRIGAETVITGAIQPFGDEYRLDLRALSVETGVIQGVTRQNIRPDNVLASLMEGVNVLPSIESWKNNWLYLGFRAGVGFIPIEEVDGNHFGGAFSITGQLTEYFGFQTELIFSYATFRWTHNFIGFTGNTTLSGPGTLIGSKLMIPLLARITIRPNNFSFGALAGASISLALGKWYFSGTVPSGSFNATYIFNNPAIAFMIGLNFGYRIGPGVLFLDVRGHYDFIESGVEEDGTLWVDNRRYPFNNEGTLQGGSINISIGYEIGLIPKKRK